MWLPRSKTPGDLDIVVMTARLLVETRMSSMQRAPSTHRRGQRRLLSDVVALAERVRRPCAFIGRPIRRRDRADARRLVRRTSTSANRPPFLPRSRRSCRGLDASTTRSASCPPGHLPSQRPRRHVSPRRTPSLTHVRRSRTRFTVYGSTRSRASARMCTTTMW